jgi:hypothetical protein
MEASDETIQLLVDKGAQKGGATLFVYVLARSGRLALVQKQVEQRKELLYTSTALGETLLDHAVQSPTVNTKLVKYLLSQIQQDPDKTVSEKKAVVNRAMMTSIYNPHQDRTWYTQYVSLFLKSGIIDVNYRFDPPTSQTEASTSTSTTTTTVVEEQKTIMKQGFLTVACHQHHREIFNVLLYAGADVNVYLNTTDSSSEPTAPPLPFNVMHLCAVNGWGSEVKKILTQPQLSQILVDQIVASSSDEKVNFGMYEHVLRKATLQVLFLTDHFDSDTASVILDYLFAIDDDVFEGAF